MSKGKDGSGSNHMTFHNKDRSPSGSTDGDKNQTDLANALGGKGKDNGGKVQETPHNGFSGEVGGTARDLGAVQPRIPPDLYNLGPGTHKFYRNVVIQPSVSAPPQQTSVSAHAGQNETQNETIIHKPYTAPPEELAERERLRASWDGRNGKAPGPVEQLGGYTPHDIGRDTETAGKRPNPYTALKSSEHGGKPVNSGDVPQSHNNTPPAHGQGHSR